MNWNRIKRNIRLQLPPEHYSDAGAGVGSRQFEALPQVTPVVTYTVLLVSVALYYLTHIATNGNPEAMEIAFNKLGSRKDYAILNGDWWGIFTNNFFHGGMLHIFMNGFMLYTLGTQLEKGIGSLKTLLLYILIGGVCCSWQLLVSEFSALFVYNQFPLSSAIGLSGILFGIVGFMWGSWKRWTGFLSSFNLRLLQFVFFWQLICFAINIFSPSSGGMMIANTAHLSGMAFGFSVGMWMCYGIKHAKLWFSISLTMVLIAVSGLLIYSERFETLKPYFRELSRLVH